MKKGLKLLVFLIITDFFKNVFADLAVKFLVFLVSYTKVGTRFLKILSKYDTPKMWMKKMKILNSVCVVSGDIYEGTGSENRLEKPSLKFQIELPYEDISENSMPLSESTRLIYTAITEKYGYPSLEYRTRLNNVKVKKEDKFFNSN